MWLNTTAIVTMESLLPHSVSDPWNVIQVENVIAKVGLALLSVQSAFMYLCFQLLFIYPSFIIHPSVSIHICIHQSPSIVIHLSPSIHYPHMHLFIPTHSWLFFFFFLYSWDESRASFMLSIHFTTELHSHPLWLLFISKKIKMHTRISY
jgi:hypothetical protein